MAVWHLRCGWPAAAAGAFLVLNDAAVHTIASSVAHAGGGGHLLADRIPLARDRAFEVSDAAATALFDGGFFGGEEPQSPRAHLPHPSHASADASMGQVLHNAVLSATTAAGDAAQQAAETARRGLEEAKNKAAEWFDSDTRQRAIDAAESARHATAEAATTAAHEAKEGLYALGSMIKEKAPGAADMAYKTAQQASSAAGRAAKELSAAATDAKSAFLTWAGQVREGVQKGSEETLQSASQAAEQAAAAAETARKVALDAAQRATKAAQEARYSLSVFGQHLQAQSASGSADSAAAATHHASAEAEAAARALEEAARTTKAALASWSDFITDTLHMGSNQAQDAASKASDAARDVAEHLHHAAVRAGNASAALLASGNLGGSTGLEMLTADSSKPLLENFMPWMSEKTEETKRSLETSAKQAAEDFKARIPSAEEACNCAMSDTLKNKAGQAGHYISGIAGRACDCAMGNRRNSILEATRRFFGFGTTPEAQVEETVHKAAKAVQDAASSSGDTVGESLKNAGRRLLNSFSRSSTAATAELRPLDGAAWLGSAPTHTSVGEAAQTAADATGLSAVKDALPSLYRGQSALDCDPLPPYKDCIAQCDADDASNTAAGGSPGLSSSEYSKKRACYLACKAKWIDTALPGCLDTSGNVIPGTAPAALFRSTTTTTTTAYPASARVGGGASSWSDFLKPLKRKDDSEEVKDKVKQSTFSWLFGGNPTTTTTIAPASVKGVFGNLFGRDKEAEKEGQWFKGVDWESWKHPLSGRSASDDKSLREKAVEEARRFADAAERKIKGDRKPKRSNTFLLISAAAILLFAVVFILIVLRRWETHHREQRVHATERQQIAENTGADIQRPLMQ
ncbi:hypothetical protein ACSSS7_001647 [Eimeria intestinalis]